jgi:hypothetical protein
VKDLNLVKKNRLFASLRITKRGLLIFPQPSGPFAALRVTDERIYFITAKN